MHYLLFYEKAPDHEQRRIPVATDHMAYVKAAANGGELVLAGSMSNPDDGAALLLFDSPSPEAAEHFAKADPYVVHGVVSRWYVRPWTTVAGKYAAVPLPE